MYLRLLFMLIVNNNRGELMISINRNLDLLIEACESYNLIPTPTKTNKKGIKLTVFDSDEK